MLDPENIADTLNGLTAVEQLLTEAADLPTHDPAALERGREAYRQLCASISTLMRDEVENELIHSPEGRRLLDRAACLAAAAEIHGITSTETF